jgi:hypothetical protein
VYRTAYQQTEYVRLKLSGTENSMHLKRLAIDINFFQDDYRLFSDKSRLKEDIDLVELAGHYWESLSPSYRWGGRFGDYGHFEDYFP